MVATPSRVVVLMVMCPPFGADVSASIRPRDAPTDRGEELVGSRPCPLGDDARRELGSPERRLLASGDTGAVADIDRDRVHRDATDQRHPLTPDPYGCAIRGMARVTITVADAHCGDAAW